MWGCQLSVFNRPLIKYGEKFMLIKQSWAGAIFFVNNDTNYLTDIHTNSDYLTTTDTHKFSDPNTNTHYFLTPISIPNMRFITIAIPIIWPIKQKKRDGQEFSYRKCTTIICGVNYPQLLYYTPCGRGHCGSGGEPAGCVGCCTRGLGLGCDASCRRWGSPTPTKVKNLLPPDPPHVS